MAQKPKTLLPLWVVLLDPQVSAAVITLIENGVPAARLRALLIKKKRGPKPKTINRPPRRRGAPNKWGNLRSSLLEIVEDQKTKMGARADKEALEALLRECAADQGIKGHYATEKFVSDHLKSWQNQVSLARRNAKNPKN